MFGLVQELNVWTVLYHLTFHFPYNSAVSGADTEGVEGFQRTPFTIQNVDILVKNRYLSLILLNDVEPATSLPKQTLSNRTKPLTEILRPSCVIHTVQCTELLSTREEIIVFVLKWQVHVLER